MEDSISAQAERILEVAKWGKSIIWQDIYVRNDSQAYVKHGVLVLTGGSLGDSMAPLSAISRRERKEDLLALPHHPWAAGKRRVLKHVRRHVPARPTPL
jgi:hypothetical protein